MATLAGGCGLVLALTRCVGSDPDIAPPVPDSGVIVVHDDAATSSGDPTPDSGDGTVPDSGADASCGPTNTVASCGRCGRVCAEGSLCTDLGQCTPQALTPTGTSVPFGFAVGDERVFLAQSTGVIACKNTTGCDSLTPKAARRWWGSSDHGISRGFAVTFGAAESSLVVAVIVR